MTGPFQHARSLAQWSPVNSQLLAARIDAVERWLQAAGLPVLPAGYVVCSPADRSDVGFAVGGALESRMYVLDVYAGPPCYTVPAGHSVADLYRQCRAIERAGFPAGRMRLFGPPGWEHVEVPLLGARTGDQKLPVVPAQQMTEAHVGIELKEHPE